MHYRRFLGVIGLIGACFVPTQGSAEDLPIPEAWSTHYVWFLVANPEYVPASKDDESALTAAHIQYQLRLQEEGRAIVAGGLGEGPGESIVGLTILRAESLAEAQAIADADPVIKAGRLLAWVREWWVPADRLPPPEASRPSVAE